MLNACWFVITTVLLSNKNTLRIAVSHKSVCNNSSTLLWHDHDDHFYWCHCYHHHHRKCCHCRNRFWSSVLMSAIPLSIPIAIRWCYSINLISCYMFVEMLCSMLCNMLPRSRIVSEWYYINPVFCFAAERRTRSSTNMYLFEYNTELKVLKMYNTPQS